MLKIGDRVRATSAVRSEEDLDCFEGKVGAVVAVWPPDGEFQYGVEFPGMAPGESVSMKANEVEKA
jgi:hypothetical protein